MASIQATHELVGGWRWVAPSGHQWRVEGERAHELGLCHMLVTSGRITRIWVGAVRSQS